MSSSVANVRGIENLSNSDLRALSDAANYIGIDVDWLAAIISFETAGTFNPSIVNRAGSGAVGLIQFISSTSKRLGTSSDELKKMSFREQLEYVKKYFAPYRGKLNSLEDAYLAVFYPAQIGRSGSDIIASNGDPATQKIYDQNKGFDSSGKGYITRSDVTSAIVGTLQRAINTGTRVNIPGALLGTVAALSTGAAAYSLYRFYKRGGS